MKMVFILVLTYLLMCQSPKFYKNFHDYKPKEDVTVIVMPGYRVKIQQEREFVDYLLLLEGKYLIEFQDRHNFIKGAALCEVEKNKIYSIRIVEAIHFPKHNKVVYRGMCFEEKRNEDIPVSKEYLERLLRNEN